MGDCSIVRELHVYGSVVPVSGRDEHKFQHQGYGALLMEWAETIARKEHHSSKIAVISGVGTRNYYRKLGYELEGPYMVKSLMKGEYINALEFYDQPPIKFGKENNLINTSHADLEEEERIFLEQIYGKSLA